MFNVKVEDVTIRRVTRRWSDLVTLHGQFAS